MVNDMIYFHRLRNMRESSSKNRENRAGGKRKKWWRKVFKDFHTSTLHNVKRKEIQTYCYSYVYKLVVKVFTGEKWMSSTEIAIFIQEYLTWGAKHKEPKLVGKWRRQTIIVLTFVTSRAKPKSKAETAEHKTWTDAFWLQLHQLNTSCFMWITSYA